ncbi:hypothetical protein [Aeromonas allosaccharophila]|uniref:hypothetical protein n=1 Tax=Aeromonas allosaccharophila TaxID=656 RepID=UPI002ADFEA91|nr:hypothetical protein [Aeromonas allosaccharophila]
MTFIILMSQTAQVLAKDEVDARTTVKISAEVKSELQLSATWAGVAGLEAGRTYAQGHKLGEFKLDFGAGKDQINNQDYSVYFVSSSQSNKELRNETGEGSGDKVLPVIYDSGVVSREIYSGKLIGGDQVDKVRSLDKGGVSVGLLVSRETVLNAGIYTGTQNIMLVRN